MNDQGVSRKVIFQAWCNRCEWKGEQRDAKYVASYDLAGHNVDHHGGADRIGAEQ